MDKNETMFGYFIEHLFPILIKWIQSKLEWSAKKKDLIFKHILLDLSNWIK